MNSPSSMSQRVCDAAPERCSPRCSVRRNTIIFVLAVVRSKRHSFRPWTWCHVVIAALTSVWITVIQGSLSSISFLFLPLGLSPLGITVQQHGEQVPSGLAWLRSLGTEATGGDRGIGSVGL